MNYTWPYPGDVPFSVGQLAKIIGFDTYPFFRGFRELVMTNEHCLSVRDPVDLAPIANQTVMVITIHDPLVLQERTDTHYLVQVLSSLGTLWLQREFLQHVTRKHRHARL